MDEAKIRLKHYLEKPTETDPTLVNPLLTLGAYDGDAKIFDAFLNKLKKVQTPEQRDQLIRALGEFEQPQLAQRLLALTLTNDIRGQDVWKAFRVLLANSNFPAVQAGTWTFIKKKLVSFACESEVIVVRCILLTVLAALWSLEWRKDVHKAFFTAPANYVNSQDRNLAQALEL